MCEETLECTLCACKINEMTTAQATKRNDVVYKELTHKLLNMVCRAAQQRKQYTQSDELSTTAHNNDFLLDGHVQKMNCLVCLPTSWFLLFDGVGCVNCECDDAL